MCLEDDINQYEVSGCHLARWTDAGIIALAQRPYTHSLNSRSIGECIEKFLTCLDVSEG